MPKLTRFDLALGSLTLALVSCSGTDAQTLPGSGGTLAIGGAAANGGATAIGTVSQGGNPGNVGGAVGSGGKSNIVAGGSPAVGGFTAANGGNPGGGVTASGGSVIVGGSKSAGGSSSIGGSKPTGGTTSTGGMPSVGGASPTGGTSSASSTKATGGTTAAGGGPGTGGTTSSGGVASFRCDNLSMPVGTTGKAKPSGAAGGLKVLDWAGFTGAVSFTFDDSNTSQITDYSQLKATGAHMTFFMITGSGNASNATWKTAIADGNEIGNHTKSHSSTASQSDLQAAEDFIKSTFSATAFTMAAPNGASGWTSVAPAIVFLNRGVANNLIGPRDSTDPFTLPAYIPATGADSATMDGQVTSAKSANKWRIFCIHGFDSANGTYQPVPIGNVTTTMSNAVKSGVWAESMVNVGAYWLGQKAISASATTSATWTLPSHFPPNMCVRITTTGGTVTQKGAAVPWDDHGYYQISLDAGAVTIQ